MQVFICNNHSFIVKSRTKTAWHWENEKGDGTIRQREGWLLDSLQMSCEGAQGWVSGITISSNPINRQVLLLISPLWQKLTSILTPKRSKNAKTARCNCGGESRRLGREAREISARVSEVGNSGGVVISRTALWLWADTVVVLFRYVTYHANSSMATKYFLALTDSEF